MSEDKGRRIEIATMSFRSMRRKSRSLSSEGNGDGSIANIFSDTPATPDTSPPGAETPSAPVEPGPAHVEASTRKLGNVKMLLAPDASPKALTAALVAKAAKIGRFCDRALLFQAEYEGGESSLMVCFSDVEDSAKARIEGAVADALMASGHEEHALGVLFLPPDSGSLRHIERLALDLKAGG